MNAELRSRSRGEIQMVPVRESAWRRSSEAEEANLRAHLTEKFRNSIDLNVSHGLKLDERVAFVLEMMHSSSNRSVPVKSVAAMLGISPSRLRHLFKEQLGISLHKYEIFLRLEHVRLILRTTDCCVKQAARFAGFSD
jgi:transcriptional regulator GlxA family with amidase domain